MNYCCRSQDRVRRIADVAELPCAASHDHNQKDSGARGAAHPKGRHHKPGVLVGVAQENACYAQTLTRCTPSAR